MIDLQQEARKAIDKLFRYMHQAVVTATFTNVTSVYDPLTQSQVRSETSVDLKVYKASFSDKEVDNTNVSQDDFKVIGRNWLMNGFEVDDDTECVIDGKQYNVVRKKLLMLDQMLWVQLRA